MKKFILTMAIVFMAFAIGDVLVPDQAQAQLDPWACGVAEELGYKSRNWNLLCVWMMALADGDNYLMIEPTKRPARPEVTPATLPRQEIFADTNTRQLKLWYPLRA